MNQVGANGDRPIHIACIRGDLDDVVALVEAGADVNAAGDLGYAALHHAAEDGRVDIINVLLGCDANVNAANEFGETPLDLARLRSNDEVAKLLELAGKNRS